MIMNNDILVHNIMTLMQFLLSGMGFIWTSNNKYRWILYNMYLGDIYANIMRYGVLSFYYDVSCSGCDVIVECLL